MIGKTIYQYTHKQAVADSLMVRVYLGALPCYCTKDALKQLSLDIPLLANEEQELKSRLAVWLLPQTHRKYGRRIHVSEEGKGLDLLFDREIGGSERFCITLLARGES